MFDSESTITFHCMRFCQTCSSGGGSLTDAREQVTSTRKVLVPSLAMGAFSGPALGTAVLDDMRLIDKQ